MKHERGIIKRSGHYVPKEYMWSIENAVRDNGVRIGTLFAIARALGCEVGDLLPNVSDVSQSAAVFDETIVRAV